MSIESTVGTPSEGFPDEPVVVQDWSMSPAAVAAGHVASLPTAGNANVTENLEEQKARLDGIPAPEVPSTDPKDIIATTERDSEAWLSAREELKKSLPAVVEVMKNPGIQKELEAQSVEPSLEDLVKQLLLNRYPEPADLIAEFETFRKQVIAAFAHLGLDVRKHFGV